MSIRLSDAQQDAIKACFVDVFEHGEIYLFGSRVDETQKGGDIDLYIIPAKPQALMQKKIQFLAKLKQKTGQQKIDVVMDTGQNRLIDKIAKQYGVLLCRQA